MTDRSSAASVRQRLYNRSKESGEDFQYLLTRYGIERLLFRLTRSPYRDRFVLKGALLFTIWTGSPHRATRDIDLHAVGDSSIDAMTAIFREILDAVVPPDGIDFDSASIRAEVIREDGDYAGVRVTMEGRLAEARIQVQVDVAFGDAITPGVQEATLPPLLDFESPRLRVYPVETVIAEKYQAMVKLGITNSRMKDFYDIYVLSTEWELSGTLLRDAIQATFRRRGTAIPFEAPIAFTDEFTRDEQKMTQWRAFARRTGLTADGLPLHTITTRLALFLLPPSAAAASDTGFDLEWKASTGWT